jgi:hypothetical protein
MNEIILDVAKEFFELQIDQSFTQSEIEDILYEFSHKMCELQKVECSKKSTLGITWGKYYSERIDITIKDQDGERVDICVNSNSIINCKNVCDE